MAGMFGMTPFWCLLLMVLSSMMIISCRSTQASSLTFSQTIEAAQRQTLEPEFLTMAADEGGEDVSEDEDVSGNEVDDSDNLERRGKLWAVLVAGSNGYYNYRHQADVCHAYQILRRNGVPDENIIVMMYDDIANNTENPTPGIIVNRPNGTDVYHGVPKDYVGANVTPETFIDVLLGNAEALKGKGSGKFLNSGPNDFVFINFVDHGAPGLVAFPESELYSKDLKQVLGKMHHQNKFSKLVFYLEACESGSMFQRLLPPHWNIFAMTASNSDESSYACYFDEFRNTYLGDVFSIMWLENADSVDLSRETIQRQFMIVKNETNTSHVQEFGDRRLRPLPASDFLGPSDPLKLIVHPPVPLDPVDSRDVPRVLLERKLLRVSLTAEEKRETKYKLNRLHKMRKLVTNTMTELLDELAGGNKAEKDILMRSRFPLVHIDCYEQAAKFFSKNCFSIAQNTFVRKKLFILVNICERRGWPIQTITRAMAKTCHHPTLTGIH